MALVEWTSRLIQTDLDDITLSDPDPGNAIEQTIREMEICHAQLRQALVTAITSQKRNQQICIQVQQDVDKWQNRVQLAMGKGREDLAQEALNREKALVRSFTEFKSQIKKQTDSIEIFKQHLDDLTAKICEARAKQVELSNREQKVREKSLKLQPLRQESESNEKILLAVDNLEKKLNRIQLLTQEAFSDLSVLKAFVSATQKTRTFEATAKSALEVDAELEALKSQLDQL